MKIEYAEIEGVVMGLSAAVSGIHLVDGLMAAEEYLYIKTGAERIIEILSSEEKETK